MTFMAFHYNPPHRYNTKYTERLPNVLQQANSIRKTRTSIQSHIIFEVFFSLFTTHQILSVRMYVYVFLLDLQVIFAQQFHFVNKTDPIKWSFFLFDSFFD